MKAVSAEQKFLLKEKMQNIEELYFQLASPEIKFIEVDSIINNGSL